MSVAVLAALPSLPHFLICGVDVLSLREAAVDPRRVDPGAGRRGPGHERDACRGLPVATAVSSVLLVLMGWAIARTRSRETFERSMS